MKGKYAVVELDVIGGEEYQDVMCYNHIFIPLWKFITNRKISSVYCKKYNCIYEGSSRRTRPGSHVADYKPAKALYRTGMSG